MANRFPPKNREPDALPALQVRIESEHGVFVTNRDSIRNACASFWPLALTRPPCISVLSQSAGWWYLSEDLRIPLSGYEIMRIVNHRLSPEEYFALRDRYGRFYEISEAFYDPETGAALHPIEMDNHAEGCDDFDDDLLTKLFIGLAKTLNHAGIQTTDWELPTSAEELEDNYFDQLEYAVETKQVDREGMLYLVIQGAYLLAYYDIAVNDPSAVDEERKWNELNESDSEDVIDERDTLDSILSMNHAIGVSRLLLSHGLAGIANDYSMNPSAYHEFVERYEQNCGIRAELH